MVIKFNPAGRVTMVFGRRAESADDETGPWEAGDTAARARRRTLPAADRRRLGLGRQHVHQRRLRQLARREVRQERRLGQVLGRARHRPGPVQPAPCDRRGPQQQRVCRRSGRTGAFRCSTPTASSCRMFTIDVPPASGHAVPSTATRRPAPQLAATIGAPNSICITPGPNQVMFVGESTFPGRLFKVVARRQGAGRDRPIRHGSSSSSPAFTSWRALRNTRCTRPRRRTGACRSSCSRGSNRREAALVVPLCLLLWLAAAGAVPTAEDWPAFRGPTGQGHSAERGVPLEWSESKNIVWKTPVPGRGWSSPVVAGGRVWVTTATRERGASLRAAGVRRRRPARKRSTSRCSASGAPTSSTSRTATPRPRQSSTATASTCTSAPKERPRSRRPARSSGRRGSATSRSTATADRRRSSATC